MEQIGTWDTLVFVGTLTIVPDCTLIKVVKKISKNLFNFVRVIPKKHVFFEQNFSRNFLATFGGVRRFLVFGGATFFHYWWCHFLMAMFLPLLTAVADFIKNKRYFWL